MTTSLQATLPHCPDSTRIESRSYTAVPNELIDGLIKLELTPFEGYLYVYLLRKKWGEVDPYPKLKTIARDLGVSVSTVQRAIAQLERAGLVATAPLIGEHGGVLANTYHLLLVAQVKTGTTQRRGQEGGRGKGRTPRSPVR